MALTVTQKPLEEISRTLSEKTPIGSALKSAEWAKLPLQLRESGFFAARIESARAVSEAQSGLQKILNLSRDPNGAIAMDRSKFIAEMQKTANALGLRNADKRGSVQDFGSERRLQLIFEQQIGQAQSKAYYLSGQDPDILDAWPAQELVRLHAVKVPRDWPERWSAAGGKMFGGRMIALKTDPIWQAISRFGRPFPPFDYNSGMGLEEIDREEAESLGLISPGEKIEPSVGKYEEELKASVKGLSPEMQSALESSFGKQIAIVGDEARWIASAPPPPLPPVPDPVPVPVPPVAPDPDLTAAIKAATSIDEAKLSMQTLDTAARTIEAAMTAERAKGLARDWDVYNKLAAQVATLTEKSREAISIPEAERNAVTTMANPGKSVKKVFTEGSAVVSRFVHPDLVPQGISVVTKRGRAFYRSSTKAIHVNGAGGFSTVAHEITHDIEYSHPEISAKTKAFLQSRSDGKAPERLRKLTGNPGYRSDEIAYEDEWAKKGGSVYSGKVYPGKPTEILTMGIERLNQSPLAFFREDPEYFNFVVQTLRKW
jgi:hypothetical protein